MTSRSTQAREAVAAALAGVGFHVYPSPFPVPVPNTVTVAPDEPWQVPGVLGGYEVYLRVVCAVQDRADQVVTLEDLTDAALDALTAYQIRTVSAPATVDLGTQGSLLVSDIRLTVHVT